MEEQRERALQAATELLTAVPLEQVTVASIAREAKVSKSTIYQYWTSRDQLVLEAYDHFATRIFAQLKQVPLPDDTTAAMRVILTGFATQLDHQIGSVVGQLFASAYQSDDFRISFAEVVDRHRTRMVNLVRDAKQEGYLPPDVDPITVVDILGGALVYRRGIRGRAADPGFIDTLIDLVLNHTE